MKKLRLLALSLLFFAPAMLVAQADVLIIDFNNGFNSDQSMNQSRVRARLLATQNSVTRVNSMPAAISNTTYDQVWVYGNPGALNSTYVTRLSNFINGGGAVYMQSEVSCCDNMAALVQAVMQATVSGGGGMTHNPNKGTYYQWTTGAGVSCPGITHYGGAVRVYMGVPAQNHLFIANTSCATSVGNGDACGVYFRSCDMGSGQGGLVSAGDFNMFMAGMACGTIGIIGTTNRDDMIDLVANLMSDLVNCGTCGVVLPAKYGYFSANPEDAQVNLDWSTIHEYNLASFTVERSGDGVHFAELETVPAAGESTKPLFYRAIDRQPLDGMSFYRLRETDLNGEIAYSEVKSVSLGNGSTWYVRQDRAGGQLLVEKLPEDLQKCELLSLAGQVLDVKEKADGTTVVFETSSLSGGIYLVRVTSGGSRQSTKKVMVLE